METAFDSRQNLRYSAVAGKQVIAALLLELEQKFARGRLYRVLQDTANEARRECLLINPNQQDTYSAAVGSTSKMLPSKQGWEMTKGILYRRLVNEIDDAVAEDILEQQL